MRTIRISPPISNWWKQLILLGYDNWYNIRCMCLLVKKNGSTDKLHIWWQFLCKGNTSSSWEKQGDSIGKIPNDRAVCSLRRGRDSENYFCKASVNIIIATNTLEKYTNEQRREISFEGIFRPLYYGFIEELKKSDKFEFGYSGIVSHTYSENCMDGTAIILKLNNLFVIYTKE